MLTGPLIIEIYFLIGTTKWISFTLNSLLKALCLLENSGYRDIFLRSLEIPVSKIPLYSYKPVKGLDPLQTLLLLWNHQNQAYPNQVRRSLWQPKPPQPCHTLCEWFHVGLLFSISYQAEVTSYFVRIFSNILKWILLSINDSFRICYIFRKSDWRCKIIGRPTNWLTIGEEFWG